MVRWVPFIIEAEPGSELVWVEFPRYHRYHPARVLDLEIDRHDIKDIRKNWTEVELGGGSGRGLEKIPLCPPSVLSGEVQRWILG